MTPANSGVSLVVRRKIRASAEFLFNAWTKPMQLRSWWGPSGVTCIDAQVDLRLGGIYRIGNQFDNGKVLWITGTFELIDRPHKLVYTWSLEKASTPSAPERVTVQFIQEGGDVTEVIVIHERILNEELRDEHERGWLGCLDGLEKYAGLELSVTEPRGRLNNEIRKSLGET